MDRWERWGIETNYVDALGRRRRTSRSARAAVLAAMGGDPDAPPADGNGAVRLLRPGDSRRLAAAADLTLEDGTVLRVERSLPPDLPIGYHHLRVLGADRPTLLIVGPGKAHLPEGLRLWGWAAQLYAVRSRRSWGMGDLGDLRRLARWSARELGAGFLLLNPLQSVAPGTPQEPSPYFPSSRLFRNPLYLRIEEVPGAKAAGRVARAPGRGRPGPQPRTVHRPRRRLPAQARGPRTALVALRRQRGLRPLSPERRGGAPPLRPLLRARRAPRAGPRPLARALPPPGRRRRRALRHTNTPRGCSSTSGCSGSSTFSSSGPRGKRR